MESTALLEVSALHKAFRQTSALVNISLQLRGGECLAVTGSNGSGKSTLLNCIAGVLRPSSGVITFRSGLERHWRKFHLGALLQRQNFLYDDLTVQGNLQLYATLRRVQIDQDLERFGLSSFASRRVAELSQGLTQRTALARALIGTPSLLLLDEPFTGLDREAQAMLLAELRIRKSAGAAMIIVTHELSVIEQLADRTITLNNGRI